MDYVANFQLNRNDLNADFQLENTQFDAIFELNPAGASWGSITGDIDNQIDLRDALDAKQDVLTAGDNVQIVNNVISATDTTYTAGTGISIENGVISNTQTSAIWGNIEGTLADQTDLQNALNAKQDTISDLSTIRQNAQNGNSAYGTIQTYGDIVTYNASYFATSAQGSLADTALQPNDNISELVNDAGYITSASLPTVNDSTITIQKNGTDIESFTLNQSSNETINISVPTDTADLTNGAGFLTNNATGSQAIALGSMSTGTGIGSIAYGYSADATSTYSIAIGWNADANNTNTIAIGKGAKASASGAIALGTGAENSTASTFQVSTYQLLDLSNGLIPDARISSNIARTTDIPSLTNYVTTNTAQTISSSKAFSQPVIIADNNGLASGTILSNKKILQRSSGDSTLTLNNIDNKLRLIGSETRPKYSTDGTNFGDIALYSDIPTNYVPNTLTINGQALTGNITLTASDVNALANTTTINDLTTTAQQDALNSGITSGDVSLISTALQPNDNVSSLVNDAGYITSASLPTNYVTTDTAQTISGDKTFNGAFSANSTYTIAIETSDELHIAETTNGNHIHIANDHISIVTQDCDIQLNSSNNQGIVDVNATDFNFNHNQIATVNDIPTDTNDLTNGAGFITGITSTDVTNALGYTPYSDANPNGYITGITGADVTNALGFTPYDASNPNGYTSNIGTVTSVNNVTPVGGDVTLTATDVGAQSVLTYANAGNNIQISSELPNGFKQLTHIVFDGTQELDTGFTPNNNSKIESKCYRTGTDCWFYGASPANPRVTLYHSGTGTSRWGNQSKPSVGLIANTEYKLIQDKNGIEINGVNNAWTSGTAGDFTCDRSLTIGNCNGSISTPKFSGNLYYLKIYDNENIVRDYVPALRVSDNAVGLYDKVNYTFLTDPNLVAGTGVNTTLISFVNNTGYITGINSSDVTTALGYTPYSDANPNGYTSNTGTVTSVNNVSPVSGNVTLSIPTDTSDLTNGAGYITSSALSGYATETWVGNQGYALSSSLATVATSGDYDDLLNRPSIPSAQVNSDWDAISGVAQILNKPTIPTEVSDLTDDTATYPIDQADTVTNQNSSENALKYWTGTKAQYDAIVTKDVDTLYNITDDNTADAYQAYTKSEVDNMFVTVDLDNLSNVGKQKIIDCVMPSTSRIDFTITTTGQTILMPNSGYLQVIAYGSKSTDSFIGLYGNVSSMVIPFADNVDMRGFIPVSEGENVQVYFNNATNIQVYLQKSKGVI